MNTFSCQPLLDRLTHVATKSGFINKFKAINKLEVKLELLISDADIKYDENTYLNIRNEIDNLLHASYIAAESHGKSEMESEKFKSKGSKAYLEKKDKLAHNLYTNGLRYAPKDTLIQAVLYANRSATHFQMKQYQHCLDDIKRAEAAGYPVNAKPKLLRRKIKSIAKLYQRDDIASTLLDSEENLKCSSQECHGLLKSLEQEISALNLESNLKLFVGESRTITQMSAAMEMRVNEREGRHIYAITDIPKGSVIFQEKPYASILLPEHFLTHCQKCLAFAFNPIPCDGCSDVVWCSEKCKTEGLLYHQYECGILHIISSVGIAHLALRIVLVSGWSTCIKTKMEKQKNLPNEKIEDLNNYFSYSDNDNRYKAVYSLLTHLDKALPEDQLQYALAAIILSKAIEEKTTFMTDVANSAVKDKHLLREDIIRTLPCILIHHIAQLVSNAHAVTQIRRIDKEKPSSNIYQFSQRRIASAIYPSASLMNHSCKPSIINSFYDDMLIIRSTEEIKSGQQVYNSYGPHANRQEREERQVILQRQYFFTCRCHYCTEEKYLIREAKWSGLKCPKCCGVAVWKEGLKLNPRGTLICLECKINMIPSSDLVIKCSTVNELYQAGEEAETTDLEQAEHLISKAIELAETIYVKENQFLNTIKDTHAKVLASQGKYDEALTELSFCLDLVKSKYGEESVEVAFELIKYLDVFDVSSDRQQSLDKHASIKKRIDNIFSIHYGDSWKKYLQMEDA